MLGKSFPSRVLSLPFCGTLGRLMISSFVVVSPHLGAIWSVLPHLHGGTSPSCPVSPREDHVRKR